MFSWNTAHLAGRVVGIPKYSMNSSKLRPDGTSSGERDVCWWHIHLPGSVHSKSDFRRRGIRWLCKVFGHGAAMAYKNLRVGDLVMVSGSLDVSKMQSEGKSRSWKVIPYLKVQSLEWILPQFVASKLAERVAISQADYQRWQLLESRVGRFWTPELDKTHRNTMKGEIAKALDEQDAREAEPAAPADFGVSEEDLENEEG